MEFDPSVSCMRFPIDSIAHMRERCSERKDLLITQGNSVPLENEIEPKNAERQKKIKRVGEWISRVFFWTVIAALLFLSLMYLLVSDSCAFGEYITIWPPFLWCFLTIGASALACHGSAKKKAAILLGAHLAFLSFTVEWIPILRFGDAKPLKSQSHLRLISWNVNSGWAGEKKAFFERLEDLAPDICFFQETPDSSQSIQDSDLRGAWQGWHWIDIGDCGILSRYPMRRLDSQKVGGWEEPLTVAFDLPNSATLVGVNVRLMLPSLILNPLNSRNRRQLVQDHKNRIGQFPKLKSLLEKTMEHEGTNLAILAGDFNSPSRRKSLKPLKEILADVWPIAGRGWGGTITQDFPVSRIDQCWVSPNIRPISACVLPGEPSDHNLLLVDLSL